jgi:hypothetical protein
MSDPLRPVGERLSLTGVFLHGASVVRGNASHLTPGAASADSLVSRIELGVGTAACYVEATASLLNSDRDCIVTMSASFALVYSVASPDEPLDHADLRTYAELSGRIQAQPFIREYFAATSARMGLPVFYLPLLEHRK